MFNGGDSAFYYMQGLICFLFYFYPPPFSFYHNLLWSLTILFDWPLLVFDFTSIICFSLKAITTEQLMDNGEYDEILEDMRDECCKFGMHVV